MKNIAGVYETYDDLIDHVSLERVEARVEQVSAEMVDFLNRHGLQEQAYVNEMALVHAVMDYFSDIQRLKEYHGIERINDQKIKAYETFWLLKRKPIQMLPGESDDDRLLFVNERFLLARLTSFLVGDNLDVPLTSENADNFKGFLDTLYYYLKFRRCEAQTLELMLLVFRAGEVISSR